MLNVAIVGCGRIADLHAAGYRGLADARIYAVCDSDPETAARRQAEWGAQKAYARFADLLADPEVQALEILTPQTLHEPMVLAAARAGKHVALQKPMTTDLAGARRMILAMRAAGLVFRVTDNYLFYPPLVALRELIRSGDLGAVTSLRIKFLSGGSGGWDVPASSWAWRMRERDEGRGLQTFDHGHHLWATAIHLLGPVEKVSAWIDSVDGVVDCPATVMWKYAGRPCYGLCEYVHAPDVRVPSLYYANDEAFEVSGSRGVAVVRRCTGNIDEGPPLSLFTSGGWRHFPDIPSDWQEGFTGATRNFIDAINGRDAPRLTGEDAWEVLRLSLAIQKSARRRREVWLEEMDSPVPALARWRRRRAERPGVGAPAGRERSAGGLFGGAGRHAGQAGDLTRALVGRFDASRAEGWSTVIGLRLLADGGAPETLFGLHVAEGRASLTEGALPDDAVLTISLPAGAWAAILLKKQRLETVFLRGKLKAEGRVEDGLKLRSAFGL